jgi:single-strand DNA-binding protein
MPVVAWNKLGEICAEYLRKGSRVYIADRVQTRSWEDQDSGEQRYKTDVVASEMIMLDTKDGRDAAATPEPTPPPPSRRRKYAAADVL